MCNNNINIHINDDNRNDKRIKSNNMFNNDINIHNNNVQIIY